MCTKHAHHHFQANWQIFNRCTIKKAQEELSIFMHNINNLVKTRATEDPITQIVSLAIVTLGMIKQKTKTMILNLPTSCFHPMAVKSNDF